MKVVHVLRKPCSEPTVAANVIRYGTGALNIDATRIGYEGGEVDFDRVQRQQNSEGAVTGAFGAASLIGKAIPTYKPGGRWPANLVLQHLDGCVQDGTRTVRGEGHFPATRPTGSIVSGPAGHRGQTGLAERHLTSETVAAWVCAPGCPVMGLDAQSGERKTTWVSPSHQNNRKGDFLGALNHPGHQGYNDTGGASRFFKQVKA